MRIVGFWASIGVATALAASTVAGCDSGDCTSDDQCPNDFICNRVYPTDPGRGVCATSCEGSAGTGGTGSDQYCVPGSVCSGANYTCESAVGRECTHATDEFASLDCNGLLCDVATSRCVAPVPCTDDSECGDYRCVDGRYCAVHCETGNEDVCADGLTCNTATGACE